MDNTDRLLNKIISVLLFTVLLIMLTIGSIFIMPPSFADSGDGDISTGLLAIYPYSSAPYYLNMRNYPVAFVTVNNNSFYYCAFNCASNESAVYIGYINSSSSICFASFDSTAKVAQGRSDSSNTAQFSLVTFDDTNSLYYYNINDTFTVNELNIPSFDDVSSFLSYVANGGVVTSSFERTIKIEPGYVAYIETDGGTLDIIAQFPVYSRLSRPLWENSVQIAFGVYAPAPGNSFTFTNNFGSSIDWLIPASAPTNLLGQSKIGGRQYTAGLPDNGSSVAIYNPAYSGLSSNSNDYGRAIKAPTLTVTISNCVFVEWFKLRTDATISVQSGPAIVANSDDNYTSSVIYMPDEGEGDSVVTDADCYYYNGTTNTTSAGVVMNAGGSNYGTDDIVEDANNMLDNFEEKVTSLLSAPIKHITNLVNNATSFFTEIIHFFDWLPDDVRSVIISCLALIPVIGFIKLLF